MIKVEFSIVTKSLKRKKGQNTKNKTMELSLKFMKVRKVKNSNKLLKRQNSRISVN